MKFIRLTEAVENGSGGFEKREIYLNVDKIETVGSCENAQHDYPQYAHGLTKISCGPDVYVYETPQQVIQKLEVYR
jgi:hypothetical protein